MSKKEYLKHWRRNQTELQNLFEEEIPALVSSPEVSDSEGEQMRVKTANVSCNDPFSETSELEKTVYDDHEELSSAFQSTVEHLTDSDNDLDEEIKMEIDFEESDENISSDIAEWASKNLITHTALRELLVILKNHGHSSLPRDPRTLLKVPRIIFSTRKCGGDYVYLGLRSIISNFLSNPANNCDIVELIINIDGLPLFKSASTQLWPILAKVNLGKPGVVALFCGKSKPDSIEEYLSDFLHKYKQITENGFAWDDKIYSVKIKALVCDAPARQFVKCIKGHSGYFSCERCEIKGNWEQGMYFAETDSTIREDSKFSSFEYEDHQIQRSPLIDYGISCIKQFPLDYMHLVCLGVTKRILLFMKEGPLQSAARLSQKQVKDISFKLESLTGTLPSEFARQPRSLEELKRWKATEFRQFLLYTGPVVLKDDKAVCEGYEFTDDTTSEDKLQLRKHMPQSPILPDSPSLPCSSSSPQESSPEIVKSKKKKKSTRFTSPHKRPLKTLPLTSPMKKSMKRSIFPASSSSPIPCKKSAQSKQLAATQFVDIEREVLSSAIATTSGTAAGVEENDEQSVTEVNSRKGGRVFNKEKYPMSDTKFQKTVIYLLTEIRTILKSRQEKDVAPESSFNITTCETMSEFDELESKIKNREQFNLLVSRLVSIGGTQVKDIVTNIMTRLMSNAVMAKFNMKGAKGEKVGFTKKTVYTAIKEAALKRLPTATEAEVKQVISAQLKYAPDRAQGGGRGNDGRAIERSGNGSGTSNPP